MSSILINGKNLEIADILSASPSFIPESEFENGVVDFFKNWQDNNVLFEVNTSGSTGISKIIRISKEAMIQSSRMTAAALGLKAGMTSLLAMDTEYIAGKMMIARALTLDMTLIAVEPSSNPFLTLESETKIDFTALVPMQINQILEDGDADLLDQLQVVLVGGGIVPNSLEQKIESLNVPVYHSYGMTETITHIALRRVNGDSKSEVYKTLPGIQIAQDNRNCLLISGSYLSGEIITNDVVDIKKPDQFRWLGRIDNVINSGGIKIHPEIIEPIIGDLLKDQGIVENIFFVAGIPDEKLGEQVVLLIEGQISGTSQGMLQLLKKHMELYQCPKRIILLNRFERTETGKLKRRVIVEKYLAEIK